MIPRILHQIWIGDDPIPATATADMKTWRAQNPDWDIRLWKEPPFHLVNQEEYDISSTAAQKADILRYELLFHFGGVYADVDVACLKTLDPLLSLETAFAGYENDAQRVLCNAVLGSPARSRFIRSAIEALPERFHGSSDVSEQTGPTFITGIARSHPELVVCMPECVFYPLSVYTGKLKPAFETLTVHHWLGSWRKSMKRRDAE